MNARKRLVIVAVTAGVVGLGAAAIAVPAVAGLGPFGGPGNATAGPGGSPGPGWGNGFGMVTGPNGGGMCCGGAGQQARDGGCLDGRALPAQGDLTAQQQSALTAMAGDEKLAHDLYVAFAAQYDAVVFDRIAASETQHLAIVRTLLERYGLSDPTAGRADGQFADPALQSTYDRLLAEGAADLAAALSVGRAVEQADIDALRAALVGLTAPDVTQVYEHMVQASQRHLAAFERWS